MKSKFMLFNVTVVKTTFSVIFHSQFCVSDDIFYSDIYLLVFLPREFQYTYIIHMSYLLLCPELNCTLGY